MHVTCTSHTHVNVNACGHELTHWHAGFVFVSPSLCVSLCVCVCSLYRVVCLSVCRIFLPLTARLLLAVLPAPMSSLENVGKFDRACPTMQVIHNKATHTTQQSNTRAGHGHHAHQRGDMLMCGGHVCVCVCVANRNILLGYRTSCPIERTLGQQICLVCWSDINVDWSCRSCAHVLVCVLCVA